MDKHLKHPTPIIGLRFAASLGVCVFALTACWSSDSWDKEYICKGQERSTTHLQGHPQSENYEKYYAAEVDFHVRGGSVLVKSHQATVAAAQGTRLTFQADGKDSTVNGTFDATAMLLLLQENRTLVVDGTPQELRISGNYICTSM